MDVTTRRTMAWAAVIAVVRIKTTSYNNMKELQGRWIYRS